MRWAALPELLSIVALACRGGAPGLATLARRNLLLSPRRGTRFRQVTGGYPGPERANQSRRLRSAPPSLMASARQRIGACRNDGGSWLRRWMIAPPSPRPGRQSPYPRTPGGAKGSLRSTRRADSCRPRRTRGSHEGARPRRCPSPRPDCASQLSQSLTDRPPGPLAWVAAGDADR
jgi:hypothetical protein